MKYQKHTGTGLGGNRRRHGTWRASHRKAQSWPSSWGRWKLSWKLGCSMWGDWRKWSHHSTNHYFVFSFSLNPSMGFFFFSPLGQVGRKRLWVMGRAILVSSACPHTYGLFSDLRQYLFSSQVFLLQAAPGGTSLPWIQHSPHLVDHMHALLLAANRRERGVQSFPQGSVSRIQVLRLSRSTLFFCLCLALI